MTHWMKGDKECRMASAQKRKQRKKQERKKEKIKMAPTGLSKVDREPKVVTCQLEHKYINWPKGQKVWSERK